MQPYIGFFRWGGVNIKRAQKQKQTCMWANEQIVKIKSLVGSNGAHGLLAPIELIDSSHIMFDVALANLPKGITA